MSSEDKDLPDDIVAQIILREAANQDLEGLAMVADTMYNRAKSKGQTLEQVATAPKQFSGYADPNLADFFARQPVYLQNYAEALVEERRNPEFKSGHPYQHYVADYLWENKESWPKDSWLHNMKEVGRVGNHVLLEDARTKSASK